MALFTFPPVSVDTSGLATEATLQQVETNTADSVTELQTLNGKDFATEGTLQLAKTALDDINNSTSNSLTELQTLNAVDFATETSLSNAVTELTTLNGVDFAQEATLGNVANSLVNIDSEITAVNSKLAASLVPEPFDYQSISYVLAGNGAGEISTVVYKSGGAGGTTVATVTLTYDANNRVSTVTRS